VPESRREANQRDRRRADVVPRRYEAGHEIDKAKRSRQRRRATAQARYRQSLPEVALSRPKTHAPHALIDTQNALINAAFLFQS